MDKLFPKVLVINMDESTDRMARLQQHMHSQGTTQIQRVPAVNGKLMTAADKKQLCTPYCQRMCTPSMTGCFLSHRKAWEAAGGSETALILEDDVIFTEDAVEQTRQALRESPAGWDVLLLGCFTCDKGITKEDAAIARLLYPHRTPTQYSTHLSKPTMVFGMHAYAVSRQGAQKLLQLLPLASNHVDWALSEKLDELQLFAIRPNVAYQTGMDGSTMGGKAPMVINRLLSTIPLGNHEQDGRTLAWLCSEAWCQLGPSWMTVNKYFAVMFVLGAAGYFHVAVIIILTDLVLAGILKCPVTDSVLLGYCSLFLAASGGWALRRMHA